MINGRTRLHVVANGTMTAQRYIDEVLLPHVRLFRGAVGDKFVFMDDNATCHQTLAVQDCLDSEDLEDICPPDTSNSFEITVEDPSENEISYVEYLKSSKATSYSTGINCTLKIIGAYDIILNVKQIRFRPDCQDYLQISDGKKQVVLCGTKHEHDSNMQFYGNSIYIHYFTDKDSPKPLEFSGCSLIMTIMSNRYRFEEHHCYNALCFSQEYFEALIAPGVSIGSAEPIL
ncbi:uncharacterized protein TNCV_1657001 [Trichonephila clavipes]|nr:uncharacterized protein TNCV_1657001 [Trichonephila clavipes]